MNKRVKVTLIALSAMILLGNTKVNANGIEPPRLGVRSSIENNLKLDSIDNTVQGNWSVSGRIKPIVKPTEGMIITNNPRTQKDFENLLLNMVTSNTYEKTIEYLDTSFEQLKEMMYGPLTDAHNIVFSRYPEYFSYVNMLNMSISGTSKSGKLTIRLSGNGFTNEQLTNMKMEAYNKAEEVINKLYDESKLRDDMSETEKAKVLFEWIADNTEYDFNFKNSSRSSHGALVTGEAICHGYTGAFNLMAKMIGLEVKGVMGTAISGVGSNPEEHTWTVATLDGKKVYIDATWGDPTGVGADYRYFGASEEFMRKTHIWSEE